jgi:hypothetical protein
MVMLTQIDDLGHHLSMGLMRARLWPARAIPQTFLTELLLLSKPLKERRPTNPVIPSRHRHIAADFVGVSQHRTPVPNLAQLLSFVCAVRSAH